MEAKFRLGKIWGIPVGLHGSWFLIFILVTWSLAVGYFPAEYPQISSVIHWLLGGLTSILFFGSVLLHELGHSYVAQRSQIPVRRITLFLFGGVAQIEREPAHPGEEFRIAIAGPIVSLILAGLFGALWLLDRPFAVLAAPSTWLARINLMLALFNMIPGFPLDGGRVFRALVWKITGSYRRATEIAAMVGQWVAFGFIGFGVWTILRDGFFNGLWLIFIGWFLQNAASASYSQMILRELLRGVTVGQVMVTQCRRVPDHLSLIDLVNKEIFQEGLSCFFVGNENQTAGVLTLRDIKAIPREQWEETRTRQAMVPVERLVTVQPNTELLDALMQMDQAGVAQLPVMQNGNLLGLLTREQIIHLVRVRGELEI